MRLDELTYRCFLVRPSARAWGAGKGGVLLDPVARQGPFILVLRVLAVLDGVDQLCQPRDVPRLVHQVLGDGCGVGELEVSAVLSSQLDNLKTVYALGVQVFVDGADRKAEFVLAPPQQMGCGVVHT